MSNLKLSVDLNHPVQENFLGNGAVFHGYAGMPDERGRVYTPEQIKIEADRAGDMKLKIARTFYVWYAWEDGKWNWESHRMQVFYRWVSDMKERGVEIALHTGWNSPGDINSSHWNGESPFHVEGNWKKSLENYGAWVSETVHQLVEVRGFTNVKYLMMFAEPQHGAGKIPEGKTAYEVWLDAVRAAHSRLTADGRRGLVKLVGPNEGSTITSDMLKWATENANDYIDIFSSHNYLTSDTMKLSEIKSGNRAVRIQVPGGRTNQTVKLKPNTDYEVSVHVLLNTGNPLQISGYLVFGAFNSTGSEPTILSGGSPTNRLTKNSVKMVDGSILEGEYQKLTHQFNSSDNTVAEIGLFFDIKAKDTYIVMDDFCLCEAGSDCNLLVNPSFENDLAWRFVAATSASTDAYYDWQLWASTGMQYVPKGKGYWYDEYNVLHVGARYEEARHGSRLAVGAVALMNIGVQSSIMWTVFDQQWPNNDCTNNDLFVDGDHRFGLMPVLTRSLVPYPGYNAFAIISKYVGGEGTKVFAGKGSNNVQFTVTFQPDGSKTVVVVNSKDQSDDFMIDFGKNFGCTLYRHLFDPETEVQTEKAEITGVDKVFVNVENILSDTIPAFGVAVYTSIND